MNTAAILPHEERCVYKCHGSESVCVTPSHLSYIIFSCLKNGSPAQRGRTSCYIFLVPTFVCLHVPVPLRAVEKEVKGEGGLKRRMVELE